MFNNLVCTEVFSFNNLICTVYKSLGTASLDSVGVLTSNNLNEKYDCSVFYIFNYVPNLPFIVRNLR